MISPSTIWWMLATVLLFKQQTAAMPTETDPDYSVPTGGMDPSKFCTFNNRDYEQGEFFWPDHCSTCFCEARNKVSCNKETCSPANCPPYHREETIPGQCCSKCTRITCYWRGSWYQGGETWQGTSLDNGQYCKTDCLCTADSNVHCNKTNCRSIPASMPERGFINGPYSLGTKGKVCRDGGIKYRPGQNWTKEMVYHRRRCTVPCTCKKSGKSQCTKSVCKLAKPTSKYQLRPRGNQRPCSNSYLGEHQHGHQFLHHDQNNARCVKQCICLSGNFYCNKTSCTQASEKMPRCELMRAKPRDIQVSGCTSVKRQPSTHCPQFCASSGSLRSVKCCRPVDVEVPVLFKCPDGRRRQHTVRQTTDCRCSSDCDSTEVAATSGDIPSLVW